MRSGWLRSGGLALAIMAGSAGLRAPLPAQAPAERLVATPGRAEILAIGERVADYHVAQLAGGSAYPKVPIGNRNPIDPKGWEQGAFLIGLATFADASGAPRYRQMILERGAANDWTLGDRLYHADDHMIGQTYFWTRSHGMGDAAIADMRARFDRILANPSRVDLKFERDAPRCVDRWCWCDALFMAPAAWLEMSRVTGDRRYRDFAMKEFWAATAYLFDESESLYFRDSSFFAERNAAGRKLFWSRGNGWVFAGLTRMIPLLDERDPDRAKLVALYKKMAGRLQGLQKLDGYWSPSLLDDPGASVAESSGTAFYVYGLAWGVNHGLLDRAAYEPNIRRGWAALVRSVHPNGRLGWVQSISDRPAAVTYDDTHDYGVGGFLLASSELLKLADH
ncbi:glycoside hydrolase family 88/105 protein [Sphingomonas zeicaulis]|uniref:glycoside hydrolase family 88/105 protein n=1 Tax=Sphingomonas zeicaulis TaxID=1632740 RepID=UPI003D1E3C42